MDIVVGESQRRQYEGDMEAGWGWGGLSGVQRSGGGERSDNHLSESQPITRNTAKYQCDAQGAKMGLPAEIFSVE